MTDLTWVLSSCVLILAVIAIRTAFGRRMRPGLRYALWGLVLLRLLYPGTVLYSPVSVQGVAEQSEVVRNFEVLRGVDTIEYMDIDSSENSGYIVCPKREGMSLEWGTPERFERMQTTLKVRDVLEPIWFTGIAITSIVFLTSNLRFYAQLRKRRKPLETDCPLRVYSVENLSSSCLLGNAIYVAAETAADEMRLRHVLAHELSHHWHGDHVWALLRCVVLALHWYNPLVWWAAALSRQDSELCADAGALKRLGEAERESYGATLIELSARHAPRASLLRAATTMTNGKKLLKERVTMIARRPRMTVAAVIAVAMIAAVATGSAFAGAAARENEATTDDLSKEPMLSSEIDYTEEVDGNDWTEMYALDGEPISEAVRPTAPERLNMPDGWFDGEPASPTPEPTSDAASMQESNSVSREASGIPSEAEVLAMRERVEAGMADDEIKYLTEMVMVEHYWWEYQYLYLETFEQMSDPDSLLWNYIDQPGEIQIGWVYDGNIDKDTVCAQEGLTEDEFYMRYAQKAIELNNTHDAESFRRRITALKASVKSGLLDEDFDRMIALYDRARETHDVGCLIELYHMLHDMDYYLLRYGPSDVGIRTKGPSIASNYYDCLSIWQ